MKILNNFLKVFLIVFAFFGLYFVQKMNIGIAILVTLLISVLTIIPNIIKKLFHYEMSQVLVCFYLIFMIVSFELGSIYNVYDTIWWFDLFTHFISGIFVTYIATIILECNKITFKRNKIFYILFMIVFSLAIAGFWEDSVKSFMKN